MLDLDLDLEADLGIDTVKQAETFQAIREEYDIPVQEDLSLRDYNTLEKVIEFVLDMRPDLAQSEPEVMETEVSEITASDETSVDDPVTEPAPNAVNNPVADQVLTLVSEQTGYPVDMLELDLDLEADLGIDTVKQAETFLAIRQTFDIPQQDDLSLRDYNTLEKVIAFVHEMRPELDNSQVTSDPVSEALTEPAGTAEEEIGSSLDSITAQVLILVAEKTGYPEEMLDLDLDLEADLGIDTVKQAETFQAIRGKFGIPMQEDLSLRDYNTLEKVIGFVEEMRPDLAEGVPGRSIQPTPEVPATDPETRIYTLADADVMPRRIPVPSLRPDLTLCKTTGVVLDGESRIVIMPDEGGIAEALVGRLEKLGAQPLLLDRRATAEEMILQIDAWLAEGAIQGMYWLPALDMEPELEEMSLHDWHAHTELRVKKYYTAMRRLYDSINVPGTFLVAASRLGGLHGYGKDGATAPMGGGVTGFTKAYHIEQRLRNEGNGPLVKAVDFAASRKTASLADLLIAETHADPGVVEVGIFDNRRYGITLRERSAEDGQPGLRLGADTVFLITGAAGGITSEIVSDLAVHSKGIFYLLDLVEAPDPTDENVQLFRRDREALKQKLIDEARAANQRPTPVAIEKEMAVIERHEAALRAIESVKAAGGTPHYHALNLLDGEAVASVIKDIRERYGKLDILVHAGGVLIDRTLPNKEPEQFDVVFDVKADGFFNILKAAKGMPLGASVAFSSVAGRFGNNGQSAYSAANDLLCKISNNMRNWRPETKAIAIDWTAWGDIGMAARGSVPTVMKALGIDMLPPASGVPTVRRELVAGGFSGEVLVAGELGIMVEEIDETGGLDIPIASEWLAEQDNDFLMVGEITGARLYEGLEIKTTFDPTEQPFLFDHAPDDDTPWLPGVMAIEGLAEAAALLSPDKVVSVVDNVEMLGAFKFFRNEPRTLYLNVFTEPGEDDQLLARVTLRSVTQPVREGLPLRIQDHFRARVWLTTEKPVAADVDFLVPGDDDLPTTADQIYKFFFHGPAYQVITRAGVMGDQATGKMPEQLPPNGDPADARTLMAPRLVELCFQLAAQWSVERKEAMAFPLGVGSLAVHHQEEIAGGNTLVGIVKTKNDGESFDAKVVDDAGRIYVDLRDYRTVSRPSLPV
jgi:NAD(P)-dependent dehydrogenase (short-subunit alcohol dehydrogenase family)/acyl carrier protein